MNLYNDASIEHKSGLAHIRHRPSAYINDTECAGQMHIIKEIIDNSVDELSITNTTGLLDVILFINRDKRSYQTVVIDNGRGIPVGRLIDVFSNTNTSGKFSTDSYRFSTGSFGVGSSVSLALSKWFRAISMNPTIIGDATISHLNIPDEPVIISNQLGRTGTIVLLEPDDTMFVGIDKFIIDFSRLSEYLIQLSLFGTYRIRFNVIDHEIPNKIRVAPTLETIEYLDNICNNDSPMYDSLKLNRDEYITNFFGISRKWEGKFSIIGINDDDTLRINGELLVSTTNSNSTNTKLTMVNDILFTDSVSYHINLLYKFIKDKIAPKITDKNIRIFFADQYKLPIWLVLDIKYAGAEFSGLAKISFKDQSFVAPYHSMLNRLLKEDVLSNIYTLIKDHIVSCYNRFSNSDFKPSNMRSLLSRLNRPDKFDNCSSANRSITELFLVEGDSAKSDQGRDSSFQASYTLGGKPFNGLTTIDKISDSITNIKNNRVFQDIIRILNITPGSNDLKNLNFDKTLIMADADTHGYHITNIIIGNMYAICPALIEEGHIYVVVPPLYSLNIKWSEPIYIKNTEELNATLAYQVYHRCIDITIESNGLSHTLSQEEFIVFSELITKIGDELDRLSIEYMIPAPLLEQLSLMTNHLNLTVPDVNLIQQWLGCEVKYQSLGHLLIVSIGSDDIVVPLNQITELIYSRILPLYREFYYGKTKIFVTTKNSTALINSPMSIVQLNEIFKRLKGMFTIKRYKGLGSMSSADRAKNCLNPNTRRVYQIKSIGDLKIVFNMLGSDPSERKKLIVS